jgi:anti-sigma regulatory factor (Ser/Thr protein kinase)
LTRLPYPFKILKVLLTPLHFLESVQIPSELSAITSVRAQFFSFLENNSIDCTTTLKACDLIFTESLTNAIMHGNKSDRTKIVHVAWNISDDKRVELHVSDSGTGPQIQKLPSLPSSNEENGRGLYIIMQLCDECEHTYPDSGGYRQILKRSIFQRT